MVGVYEVRRSDGLRCHDVHTRFHKDWFRHSKVIHRHAGRRQHEILIVVIGDKINFYAFMVFQDVTLCNATNLSDELTASILKMQKLKTLVPKYTMKRGAQNTSKLTSGEAKDPMSPDVNLNS
jgi:hypothetical protein